MELTAVNGYLILTPEDDTDDYERLFRTNSDLALQQCTKGKLVTWDADEPGFLERFQNNDRIESASLVISPDTLFYFKPFCGTYFKTKNLVAVHVSDILFIDKE